MKPVISMWSSTRWHASKPLLLALAWCLIGPALAHPQLPGSRLQGEAPLRFWGMPVYHARLWALPGFNASRAGDEALVLELEYLRDFQGSAIAERSLQEMRRAGSFSAVQAQRWLAQMQRVFPDVKAGDRLAGHHQPGRGIRFWHNDRLAGHVDDAEFAQLFLGIWLAPSSSRPEMRHKLLGLHQPGQP